MGIIIALIVGFVVGVYRQEIADLVKSLIKGE